MLETASGHARETSAPPALGPRSTFSSPCPDVRVAGARRPSRAASHLPCGSADTPCRATPRRRLPLLLVSVSAIWAPYAANRRGFFIPAFAPYGYTAGPEGVELLEIRTRATVRIQILEMNAGKWAASPTRRHPPRPWRPTRCRTLAATAPRRRGS